MTSRSVTARNDAHTSENKIHDDEVARAYGFRGGLVPGVTVYAYVTRAIVDELGPVWLERGTVDFRLPGPLYEGEQATATARPAQGSADRLVEVRVVGPAGDECLTGTAGLPAEVAWPAAVAGGGDLPVSRPEASEASLAPGTVLAPIRQTFDSSTQLAYLDLVADDLPLYRSEGIAHPGWVARLLNQVLSANVALGPWIHVGSSIRHHGLLQHGQELEVRGVVIDNWERKGHHFVDLDVEVTGDQQPVASARHTAIWRVRRAAA